MGLRELRRHRPDEGGDVDLLAGRAGGVAAHVEAAGGVAEFEQRLRGRLDALRDRRHLRGLVVRLVGQRPGVADDDVELVAEVVT
ncbi:hypothetical protein [Halosegnis marinus]|uniref:hypothetical protein n=1 Tax=Halosegnis marinus TaxID=3034023 RepID=UPI003605E983